MTGALIRGEDTAGRKPREAGSRDWTHTATSQGTPEPLEDRRGKEGPSP